MRWLLGILTLLGAGAGLWVALGMDCPDAADPGDAEVRSASQASPQGPLLRGLERGQGEASLSARAGHGRIEGRVLSDGRPAAGAAVTAHVLGGRDSVRPGGAGWSPLSWARGMLARPADLGPVVARATAGPDGRFTLEGLTVGTLRLVAASGARRAEANVSLPEDGARVGVLLELRSYDQSLAGRVTWADGRAFPGTLVLTFQPGARNNNAFSFSATAPEMHAAEIGPDGAFRLDGLRTGLYSVRALGEQGIAYLGSPVTLPSTGPYTLVVSATGAPLAVRVVEALSGAPVAGASVVSASQSGREGLFSLVTTDAEGRATVSSMSRPGQVSVEARGFAPAWRGAVTGVSGLTVRLARTGRVAGRVTQRDGRPAAGAVVVASGLGSRSGAWSWSQARREDVADRDGRYALEDLPAGQGTVMVRGGGFMSPEVGELTGEGYNPLLVDLEGGASVTLDLVVVPAAQLTGRVLDADGAPVPGAVVRTNVQGGQRGNDWAVVQALGSDVASTDEQGAFRFESLVPGFSVSLNVTAPEKPTGLSGPHAVSASAPTEVEVRLARGRYVDVSVVYEEGGGAVAGAQVQLMARQAEGGSRGAGAGGPPTDAQGRTRAGPAGDGELGVWVSGEGLANAGEPTWIEGSKEGPGPFQALVRVRRGLVIKGRVLRADGTPAVGANVSASQGEERRQRRGQGAQVEADGSFVLPGLTPGSWSLTAALWNGVHQPAVPARDGQAGDSDVTLTFTEGPVGARFVLEVRVLDEAGLPVDQAQVSLRNQGNSQGSGLVDGSLRFELDAGPGTWVAQGLEAGTLVVEVSDARGPDGRPLNLMPLRSAPVTPETKSLELRLAAGRSISGRVTASDGSSTRGTLVRARRQGGDGMWSQGEARVDAAGAFRIPGLSAGTFALEVLAPPDFLAPTERTAEAGASDVDLPLVRGVNARVRVTDEAGAPLAQAMIWVYPMPSPSAPPAEQQRFWNRQRNQITLTTGSDGAALFRGLDPEGYFTLTVQPPGARKDLRQSAQQAWRPADTEVRLLASFSVSGVVRDQEGRPVAGASVSYRVDATNWSNVNTGPDGAFVIQGLAAGSVPLRAAAPSVDGSAREQAPELIVRAGAENVTLTVDRGLDLVVRVPGMDEGREGQQASVSLLGLHDGVWRVTGSVGTTVRAGQLRVTLVGLDARRTYGVWVPPRPGDDRYGYVTDLRPGGEVTVRLVRGGTIRGRLSWPQGAREVNLSCHNAQGLRLGAKVEADGTYELRGLPEGAWEVHARGELDNQQLSARASGVAAGSTLDLTLAPEPRSK